MWRLLGPLVAVMIAQGVHGRSDTLNDWRLGVSFALAGTLWGTEDNALWGTEQPLFVSGFYHHAQSSSDSHLEGRRKMLLPGLVVRDRLGNELSLAVAWIDYRNMIFEASYPAYLASSYRFIRAEYTRSTRPGPIQQPRFGFRWGVALLMRNGHTTRDFSVNRSWMRWDVHQRVDATTVMLQPTVSFGYRSQGLNAGIQLYWNFGASIHGRVWRNERHWVYGDGLPYPVDIDERIPMAETVFVDRLAQWGLLWSNLQVYVSAPLVRIGGRRPK